MNTRVSLAVRRERTAQRCAWGVRWAAVASRVDSTLRQGREGAPAAPGTAWGAAIGRALAGGRRGGAVSGADRLQALPVADKPREVRYVHSEELTGAESERITEWLTEWLRHEVSGEVPYDREENVALLAEFPMESARLVLRDHDAPGLGELLDELGVAVHPETDLAWKLYRDEYAVVCGDCRTVSFGRPNNVYAKPNDVDWPQTCDCGQALPVQHRPVVIGTGEECLAVCNCGQPISSKPTKARYASAAATRHRNKAEAEESARRAALVAA